VHFEQRTWFKYNFLVKLQICKFRLHYGAASIDEFSKGAVNKKSLGTSALTEAAEAHADSAKKYSKRVDGHGEIIRLVGLQYI